MMRRLNYYMIKKSTSNDERACGGGKVVIGARESESHLVSMIIMSTIEMIVQTLDKLDVPTTKLN